MHGGTPAQPKKPWSDDSPVNTNKQWFQPWIQSGANGFRPSRVFQVRSRLVMFRGEREPCWAEKLLTYCGWTKSCAQLNPIKPLFVGFGWYLEGNRIIPGFLRWCEMDCATIHSRAMVAPEAWQPSQGRSGGHCQLGTHWMSAGGDVKPWSKANATCKLSFGALYDVRS